MVKKKIAILFILLMFLIYPIFGVTIDDWNRAHQQKFMTIPDSATPYVPDPVLNLPDYMHKISGGLLMLVFPESRYNYDEECSRAAMIQMKSLIPADQLGQEGAYIGDIVFVEVHIDSRYRSTVDPYFYRISSSQDWSSQIWIWGWVSLDNVRELSQKYWIYSISMPGDISCINRSSENPTNYQPNISSSPTDHASPVNGISSQGPIETKSTQYAALTKLIKNNPMNPNTLVSVTPLTRNFSVKRNFYTL